MPSVQTQTTNCRFECPHFYFVLSWLPLLLQGFAHKACEADGEWFRHPETNRTWTNYTTCIDVNDFEVRLMSAVKSSSHVVSLTNFLSLFFSSTINFFGLTFSWNIPAETTSESYLRDRLHDITDSDISINIYLLLLQVSFAVTFNVHEWARAWWELIWQLKLLRHSSEEHRTLSRGIWNYYLRNQMESNGVNIFKKIFEISACFNFNHLEASCGEFLI